jgi:hypothetical protein
MLGRSRLVRYGRHKIHCGSIIVLTNRGIATKDTMWIYTLVTQTDRSHEEYTVDLRDGKT